MLRFAWVGTWPPLMMTCCFYFPAKKKRKKISLKFAESTHKRKLSVWKRTESDKFVSVHEEKIYEAGRRDRKKWSSSLPSPPPPPLLPHPLFHFLYFLLRAQHCRLGPWDRESLSVNEWQLCQPKKRKKGRMRRELGTRFDPCLSLNLQSKIEGGQKREKERQGERDSGMREWGKDLSTEVFTRWFEVQIYCCCSSFSPASSSMQHFTDSSRVYLPVIMNFLCGY